MKRIVVSIVCVVVFVALPVFQSVVHAAITIVDSCSSAAFGQTGACSLLGVQSGDIIVAAMGVEGTQTVTFSDDHGNTYAAGIDLLHSGSGQRGAMSWALHAATGDTVVAGVLSSSQYNWFCAVAVRGADTDAIFDSDTSEGAATTVTGPTLTVPSSGMIIGFFGTPGNTTIAPANGFTELEENENNQYNTGGCAYKTVVADDHAEWTKNNTNVYVAASVALANDDGQGPGSGAATPVAFPGCEGFGCSSRQAYAGSSTPDILYVTNLNNTGAGSLRAALTDPDPRVIICEVSGWITLASDIEINTPYLLASLSSCPGPLGVKGYSIYCSGNGSDNCHDTVMKHFIIAPGGRAGGNGGLGVQSLGGNGTHHNIFQNNSVFWHEDEGLYTYGYPLTREVNFRYNILSEGLFTDSGTTGSGGLIAAGSGSQNSPITNVSYIGNIIAHNGRRGCVWMVQNTEAAFVNNLCYNTAQAGLGSARSILFTCALENAPDLRPIYYAFLGMAFISGPNDADGPVGVQDENPNHDCPNGTGTQSKIFRQGTYSRVQTGQPWSEWYLVSATDPTVGSVPAELDGIIQTLTTIVGGSAVEATLATRAGARPLSRNTHDARIIAEIAAGTGSIKTELTFGEGTPGTYPTFAATCIDHNTSDHATACTDGTHQMPASPHTVDPVTGYTNLEIWIAAMDCEVESGVACWDTTTPPSVGSPARTNWLTR